jgi:hypothetical protein
MKIEDLYNKLDKIFVEHTTHQWKNGWQHEGDRLSKELTIQKNVPWNNLFLLQKTHKYIYGVGLSLDGPMGFKIKLDWSNTDEIRIDIEAKQIGDIDIFYFVDNELDWIYQQEFIVDLCQKVYDANIQIREAVSDIPSNIYGVKNPEFVKKFSRENKLDKLGI